MRISDSEAMGRRWVRDGSAMGQRWVRDGVRTQNSDGVRWGQMGSDGVR